MRLYFRISAVLIATLCVSAVLVSQEVTGSIAGTIKDQSGAVVPGATITVVNEDTGVVVRTTTTDANGDYSAPLLPIGHYTVSAASERFKKTSKVGLVLNVNDKLTVNLNLEMGSVSETVTVQAEPLQVELQTATASGLISGTQVRELSLNGRNWAQLIGMSPGVSDAGNSDVLYVGAFAPQGTNLVTFSMNGGRREHNNFMVDGADNVDRGSNLTLLSFPSIDSIAEFKVIRGQYDPEYGRADSGQVNVVTRTGTSKLHGNVFEFWRNDALNSWPFASKYPTLQSHKPYLRYHNFGGTLGGPVWIPKLYEQTNKTFFFFSEEVRRNLTYANATATIPTPGMLNGQFPETVCVAFNTDGSCATQGTSIPASSFDPVAKAYLTDIYSKYPAPNAATPGDPFGYTATLRNTFNFREEIYKIDHIFGPKLTLSGKILRDSIPTQEAIGLFSSGPPIPGIGTTSTNSPGYNYTVRATIALSPTFLIEPGYAYSYGAILSDPIGATTIKNAPTVASAVKLPFASTLTRIPNLAFAGAAPNIGSSGPGSFGPYRDYNRNHTAFSNVTKIMGSHTIKLGATYYHYNKSENAGGSNAGIFSFGSAGVPTGTKPFTQAWANFLLGRLNSINNTPGFQQTSFDLTADIKDNQFEYYAQDSWRLRPNLTFTFGARHSFFRQPTDALGLLGQFDPAAYDPKKAACVLANGNLDISKNSSGQVISTCNPNFDPLNGYIFAHPPAGALSGHQSPYGSKVGKEYNGGIAPRIGIAWDPWNNGKTSVRAGYGIFYDNGVIFGNAENDIFLGSGFVTNLNIPNAPLSNPTSGTPAFSASPPQLQSRLPIDYRYPYTQQWSIDVQREVAAGWIFDAGYYGNNAMHLPGFYDVNQPAENAYLKCTDATPCKSGSNNISFGPGQPAVTPSNTAKLNALRPFVGYAGGAAVTNTYTSNYHGLQTHLMKHYHDHSLVNVSYTWSHSLTTYIADRTTGSIMPIQGHIRDNNYGPGIGDRRHILSGNFVWDLPFFRQQQGFTGHVLGGWEVSGIQTFQTGLPATVGFTQVASRQVDPTGAGCLSPSPCSFRPNQVGDPNSGAPNTFEAWFNPAAFQDPVIGQTTVPTERPGAVRSPGFWRTDLSLFKNLQFTERFGGQFRVESFNTFNHLNPICCVSFTRDNANYNKVRAARDPRILQLGLKLNF